MATIRKLPSGRYNVQIRIKGKTAQSSTFSTRGEAESWSQEQELVVRLDKSDQTARGTLETYTLKDVGSLYCNAVLIGRPTFAETLRRLDFLSRFFPQPLIEISKRDINTFRLTRLKQVSSVTCRDEIQLISRIIKWANREMLFEELGDLPNPCIGISMPATSKPRNKVVEPDELKLLMSELPPVMATIVELAYETAMRRSEMLKLTPRHVHLEDRLASVIDGKTGDRSVPLSRRAVTILSEAVEKCLKPDSRLFPVAPHSVSTAVRRARRKVGLSEDVRLHQLRHTRCTLVARKGFNNAQIMAVSGHRDIRSVQRYTHLNAKDIVDLLD